MPLCNRVWGLRFRVEPFENLPRSARRSGRPHIHKKFSGLYSHILQSILKNPPNKYNLLPHKGDTIGIAIFLFCGVLSKLVVTARNPKPSTLTPNARTRRHPWRQPCWRWAVLRPVPSGAGLRVHNLHPARSHYLQSPNPKL